MRNRTFQTIDPELERKIQIVLTKIIITNYIQREKEKCFSQERVKNWPNTVEALRKKKDDAKFDKFGAREDEKRNIDQDERKNQEEQKKYII